MTAPTRPYISAAERQRLVKAGRVTIGQHVDRATRDIVQSYAKAWQVVRDELLQAAAEAEREAVRMGTPNTPAAYRTQRLQASLNELSRQLQMAGHLSGVHVNDAVGPVVHVPNQVLQRMSGRGLAFDLVSPHALDGIVRRTTQKIASSYLMLSDEAEQQLRTSLVRAVSAGQGPRAMARQLIRDTKAATLLQGGYAEGVVGTAREAFAGGLNRALNLARTELIDASRHATTASYLANPGLVTGWVWVAALGRRTCPACLGMNGTVHKPDEHQDGHQSCRCTQVPLLEGEVAQDAGVPSSMAYLNGLSHEERLAQLGPARVQHIIDGGKLSDFVRQQDNPGWRSSRVAVPAKDLPKPQKQALAPKQHAAEPEYVDRLVADLQAGKVTTAQLAKAAEKATPLGKANVQAALEKHAAQNALEPRRFPDARVARSWASKVWGGPEAYSDEELKALRHYTGHGYVPINSTLRSHKGKRLNGDIRALDAAMKRAPAVPENVVVVRNAGLESLGIKGRMTPKDLIGAEYVEHGYLSTSINRKGAMQGEVRLEINVPKGTRAVYVSGNGGKRGPRIISDYGGGESELLLARGQRLVIRSARQVGGRWHVVADIVPS